MTVIGTQDFAPGVLAVVVDADPTVTPVDAPRGSLVIFKPAGAGLPTYFTKDDDGSTTNVTPLGGAGGPWSFVDTITTVGLVSAVDITGLDATAEAWLIRFKLWFSVAAQAGVQVRSGGSFQTADYRFHSSLPKDSLSAYAGLNAATTDRFKIPGTIQTFAADRPLTGQLEIYDPAATDHRKIMTVDEGSWDGNSVILRHVTAHGAWDGGDGAIDQIRFLASTGNIAIGATFHVYKRTAA